MPNAPTVAITVADVLFCLPAIEAKADGNGGFCGGCIRHPEDRWSCPVCALAHECGLAPDSTLAATWAASELGVPTKVARLLARAADDPTHPLRAELEAYLSW